MPHLEPLSDELLSEAVEALKRANGNKQHAADALGLKVSTYKARLKIASRRGYYASHPAMPGFEIVGITTKTDAEGNVTSQHIREKPEQDRAPFSLPEGHAIKGVSAYLDADGNVIGQWVKTREEQGRAEFIDEVRQAFSEIEPFSPSLPADADDDLLTVYVLPDLHLGMMAWGKESGADYDLKIASKMVRDAISRLVSLSPNSGSAAIVFLGDLFHQNDQKNVTPRSGHQLDVDGRWRRVYGVGARLARDVANAVAERHRDVEVAILPGNHDEDAAVTLAVAFELLYDNDERIKVAGQPGEHWFKRFGNCLIGANHGHRMKPDRMAMMLATDRPRDWGETQHRHFFFGHVHRETASEVGPVRVESFNSPAAKDAYAAASGYRSGRSLNAVTFHAEHGEICRHRVNL